MKPIHTIALIVAAGSSTRMQHETPKPYLPLGESSILRHSVAAFLDHPEVDAVRVVYDPQHHSLYQQAAEGLSLLPPVAGGKTRQESVSLGLSSIAQLQPEYVLIHDAARPLVSAAIISRVLEALKEHKAVIPSLPVEDTLKKAQNGKIKSTVDRSDLYRAQTPQGFRFRDIIELHSRLRDESVTDDASLFEKAGEEVFLVSGSQLNFKVTTPEDLERANRLFKQEGTRQARTGMGFDVHAFKKQSSISGNVRLCGVDIPHKHSLEGHSDADVGIHALVDALLGAIGAGDIGEHFPPSDKSLKNADSAIFLEKAKQLIDEQDARIVNIDLTLICEAPKLTPHKPAMRARLAEILNIDESRINVKATTTEKLGFTGRGEGIAAQAVANVEVKGQ